jgi:hypothetical protein
MAGFWKGSGSLAARGAISNELERAHTIGFGEKPKHARPACPARDDHHLTGLSGPLLILQR